MREVTLRDITLLMDEPHVGGYEFLDDFESGAWEPYTLDIIDQYAKPGTTVLDLGSWIGPTALWASKRGAHVIAIEPDQAARSFLYRNIDANNANVVVMDGAVSDHTGTTLLEPDPVGWASSMSRTFDGFPHDHCVQVPCWTVPDIFDVMELDNVALVKVDIEGYESVILEHAAPFLANLGIPMLVAMHEPWWVRPIDHNWFNGFSSLEGSISGWSSLLAIP